MKLSMSLFSADRLKSMVYLIAVIIVMVMLLFSDADVPERDTEAIVNYLSEFTNIPNTVTSVILGRGCSTPLVKLLFSRLQALV